VYHCSLLARVNSMYMRVLVTWLWETVELHDHHAVARPGIYGNQAEPGAIRCQPVIEASAFLPHRHPLQLPNGRLQR
jgi:hypothetical protein